MYRNLCASVFFLFTVFPLVTVIDIQNNFLMVFDSFLTRARMYR